MTKLGVLALAGPDFGGTYQYTLAMLQALRHTRGFAVTLYGDPDNPDFRQTGYPIIPFAESRARQLVALAAARLQIGLPDPFAAQDILLAPIYSLMLLHTLRPFAYTLHDLQERYYPENFNGAQRAWRHQVHAQLLKRTQRVICESNHVKRDIVRFFGVPEARATVLPAPPQQQFLAPLDEAALRAVRDRLQLPERFLFYPAQFWPHKNHLRLVAAFREVANDVPDLKLVLTGKKRDDYEMVMRAVATLGLSGHVLHLGYVAQDDLRAIYALASALVMPSLFESISIPVYEAFEIGTPVAASNVLAIPEQVGDAGMLFDPTSVPAMRDAMMKVIDPAVAAQLAARGRQRMAQMTPERYGAGLQSLLESL
ncbi:MAG: glycosyltransferase family 4 protein [Bradyrhizobium sp.]|uniref:glycosyltransferase family 4 protein n=1 Tax=Bradyrhizobium sp. TaxID=376 RepID=UPI001D934B9B|nr:glycosyltransferase family 1 protein [Bradyrhizobium sp.]MBV9564982.1 glycosyltransferase family 4 protein [Bradyrhizobium sp.]